MHKFVIILASVVIILLCVFLIPKNNRRSKFTFATIPDGRYSVGKDITYGSNDLSIASPMNCEFAESGQSFYCDDGKQPYCIIPGCRQGDGSFTHPDERGKCQTGIMLCARYCCRSGYISATHNIPQSDGTSRPASSYLN